MFSTSLGHSYLCSFLNDIRCIDFTCIPSNGELANKTAVKGVNSEISPENFISIITQLEERSHSQCSKPITKGPQGFVFGPHCLIKCLSLFCAATTDWIICNEQKLLIVLKAGKSRGWHLLRAFLLCHSIAERQKG